MLDGLILKASALMVAGTQAANAVATASGTGLPWWAWPTLLFITCFVLGIVAALSGVGGGVLFTPIVGSLFPFHMDFVRGAGLVVALSGSLAAGPGLLKANLANLRLALPVALIASIFSVIGAMIGLALPTNVLNIALGTTITLVALLFIFSKNSDFPKVGKADAIARTLNIKGSYYEPSAGEAKDWTVWRSPQGFLLFIFIGLIAGMFGLGAGWANVPVLNLLMGAPLKIAVGSSKFLLAITDTSAAWVYLNDGAVLTIITVPSVLGIMFGSLVGVRLLSIAKPKIIRTMVIIVLLISGIRSLIKGIWGV